MVIASSSPTAPGPTIRRLLDSTRVRRAFRFFEEQAAGIDAEQVAICSIAAPPFGEELRARYLAEKFRRCGLNSARLDGEGNCVGWRRGRDARPLVALSAHLDTVFPPGTDFAVRRDGGKMFAPGIADDGCGLAALIALLQALEACDIETEGSLLFVGTVGEEGAGNLRGARHLLTAGEWAREIDIFLSLDGPGVERITHVALGSRRYRLRFVGPGGHSWGDFGVPNPVHALGRVIARLTSYPTPASPRTTYNVGRVEGGTGVNVIAREATLDVDLRSESAEELNRLDAFFRSAAREAAAEENSARRANTPLLELEVKLIGDRPSGETSPRTPLVQLAEEATRAVGHEPRLDCSSTDSNIAISMGIPAITIGAGGASGNSHTLDEWYDPSGRDVGLKRALLVMLGAVGLHGGDGDGA